MEHEMKENLYFTSSPHNPVMDHCLCSFVDRGSDILLHNSGTFYHINNMYFGILWIYIICLSLMLRDFFNNHHCRCYLHTFWVILFEEFNVLRDLYSFQSEHAV